MMTTFSRLSYALVPVLTFTISLTACYLYGRTHLSRADSSLMSQVRLAKQKGEAVLQLAPTTRCYEDVFNGTDEPLKAALAHYTVVVAEPLGMKSYAGDYSLYSWERFKVIETLSAKPPAACHGCIRSDEPPGDLRPLKVDEVFISQAGGILNLDGVVVFDEGFTSYTPSQKYLLFFRDSQGCKHKGTITLGPRGVFIVDGDGLIDPITPNWSPLRKYIAKYCCNSLDQLKERIQQLALAK